MSPASAPSQPPLGLRLLTQYHTPPQQLPEPGGISHVGFSAPASTAGLVAPPFGGVVPGVSPVLMAHGEHVDCVKLRDAPSMLHPSFSLNPLP